MKVNAGTIKNVVVNIDLQDNVRDLLQEHGRTMQKRHSRMQFTAF